MAQLFNVCPHYRTPGRSAEPPPRHPPRPALAGSPNPSWAALVERFNCGGRHSCFFADGRKQDQARKALENALGGKKSEFEKWDKELKKREEVAGGGASGRGGWFGGGGWLGWSGGDHFWEETQQASLAMIGIVSLYLLIAKGNIMFAVVFNSLLYVLRGTRNWFNFLSSCVTGKSSLQKGPEPEYSQMAGGSYGNQISAKERVVKKWRRD